MAELPHETHNRLAVDIAMQIIREVPQIEDRITIMESVLVGILSEVEPVTPDADAKVMALLTEAVSERLSEIRLRNANTAGSA